MKKALKNNVKDLKPPVKYICPDLTQGIAYAHLAGEIKYDAWNFTHGHNLTDLLDAMQRHLDAIRLGIDVDEDTTERLKTGGVNAMGKVYEPRPDCQVVVEHLDCIGASLNMIRWQQRLGTLIDDRDYLDTE